MKQGSEQWHKIRLGKFTASKIYVLLQNGKKDLFSVAGLNYIWQKAVERKTGVPLDSINAKSLEHGKYWEPYARDEYEKVFNRRVIEYAFKHYSASSGASPDGLVGLYGGVEIKCPIDAVIHEKRLSVDYNFLTDTDAKKKGYQAQVDMNMLTFDRDWWDFISYHPNFPKEERIMRQRIFRSEEREEFIVERLKEAENRVQKILKEGRQRYLTKNLICPYAT